MEAVTDFLFLYFRITADSDPNHKIKRCLLLERIVMTNLQSILKSRKKRVKKAGFKLNIQKMKI